MAECNCMIPMLEGAGQHAPGCSVFDSDDDEYGDYGVKNPGWVPVDAKADESGRTHG